MCNEVSAMQNHDNTKQTHFKTMTLNLNFQLDYSVIFTYNKAESCNFIISAQSVNRRSFEMLQIKDVYIREMSIYWLY